MNYFYIITFRILSIKFNQNLDIFTLWQCISENTTCKEECKENNLLM